MLCPLFICYFAPKNRLMSFNEGAAEWLILPYLYLQD